MAGRGGRRAVSGWAIAASLLLAVVAGGVSAQPPDSARVTEVIATQRPAETLLPVLAPLAGDDVVIQAWQGRLVLRGPADRVAELKGLLAQLDLPLQNLHVRVRRVVHDSSATGGASIQVRPDGTTVTVRETRTAGGGVDLQQLTLLEGETALLSLDEEIPALGVAPSGTVFPSFVPLGNALALSAVRAGDRLRLTVRQRVATPAGPGAAGPVVEAQTLDTVLMLAPGEWVPLAVVDRRGERGAIERSVRIGAAGAGIDQRRVPAGTSRLQWEVQVEPAGP